MKEYWSGFEKCVLFAVFALAIGIRAGYGMDMRHMEGSAGKWTSADDAVFLSGMIEHHKGAVRMAEKVLDAGSDVQVGNWAREILATQNGEIEAMETLARELGLNDDGSGRAMREAMIHMAENPDSDDPDMNFVMQMIPHHAGAVEMSLPALVGSGEAKIRDIARDIISAQAGEIHEFRAWLDRRARGMHHAM